MGGVCLENPMKKNSIEIDVQTSTQCSFIPFTVVPGAWIGRKVRIELIGTDNSVVAGKERGCEDLPWSEG